MILAPLLAAVAAAGAAAAAADDNPLKTFKDWTVGCDNGRRCMAVGQFPEGDYDILTIALERGPEAEAAPVIWFNDNGDDNPTDWSVDGKPLGLEFFMLDENRVAVAPQSMERALTALLSPSAVMTVVKPGGESHRISSDGAAAALRWMDSAQQRAGTVTAMVAQGPKAPSAVPAPPPLPVVIRRMPKNLPPPVSLPASEIAKWRNDIFECEDEEPSPDMVESRRLDSKTTLVMVTASCASGAYNYNYIPLLVREGQKTVIAKFADRGSTEDGDGLFNLYWKPNDDRILASYMKGRGLGDCGGGTDWVWDGTMFREVGESMMDDCRGAPGWITTFRARIVDQ